MGQDLGECHMNVTAITSSAGLYVVVLLICLRIIVANLVYCSVGPSCVCGFASVCAWSNTQEDAPACRSFTCQELNYVQCNIECNLTVLFTIFRTDVLMF